MNPIYFRWTNRNRIKQYGGGESMTDTSFGNDTDVNKIIERFARTGIMPESAPAQQPEYKDVTGFQQDLDVLLNKTNHARKELEGIQKQAQAAKAQKAQKDAEDLSAYRAAEAQTGSETNDEP